jgi:hypothetical protein
MSHDRAGIRKRQRRTEAQFDVARLLEYPKFPAAAVRPQRGGWGVTAVWGDLSIDKCLDDVRGYAEMLAQFLGRSK